MAISIGIGTQGAAQRVLRCTFSGEDLVALRERWGDRPRLVFSAEPVDGGQWLIQFQPREQGNIGLHKFLSDKDYMTYVWSLAPAELLGMAPASMNKARSNTLAIAWHEQGVLARVAGKAARQPVSRDVSRKAKVKPKPTKEKPTMSFKKTATYDLGKITSGSVRYEWASGDKGLGTLYIRKEDVGGEPPKRITITLAAID